MVYWTQERTVAAMATKQEAHTMIDRLDERDLQKVVNFISRLNSAPEDAEKRRQSRRQAFEELEALRKEAGRYVPEQMNFDAARSEAMEEKYGRFA